MKKVLLIVISCLCLQACKEERAHCWKCDYIYKGGKPDRTGDTVICNYTQTDMEIRQGKEFDGSAEGYNTWMINNCRQQ